MNPVAYTERVVRSFLRYQLTAYPFADPRLHAQMRELLSLDATRRSPLLKGPYVSLSRPFREGATVETLIGEGMLHPHLGDRIPPALATLHSHQEEAIRAIVAGKATLVSTGTGSGKTECFLYPIVSQCLRLRDEGVPPGISAVVVYPMNALAEDQLMRLRGLLAGTGISFGLYVGKTPESEAQVVGERLAAGSSRADYQARIERARLDGTGETIYPPEELCSREAMRASSGQPRILLTNVKQLELLLTRQQDVELFTDARLDYLVFDEAHTFTGALGAEAACLVRRLRAFCETDAAHTTCVATSATIVDRQRPDAARHFAARFFGVPMANVAAVGENYEAEVWATPRQAPPAPRESPATVLDQCVQAVDDDAAGTNVHAAYRALAGCDLPQRKAGWPEALHAALSRNELVFALSEALATPRPLEDLPAMLQERIGRPVAEAEILAWLTLGAAARCDGRPLLRPVLHGFVRGVGGAVVSFPSTSPGAKLWLAAEDEATPNGEAQAAPDVPHAHFPVATCTTCGQHYYIAFLKGFAFAGKQPGGGEAGPTGAWWESLEETHGGKRVVLIDRLIGADAAEADEHEEAQPHTRTAALHFCRHCGAAHPEPSAGEREGEPLARREPRSRCRHCGRAGESVRLHAVRQSPKQPGMLTSCLSCGALGRVVAGRYREPARAVRAVNVADVHVLTQDMVHHAERQRLLVFCDNRQDAAFQAGWMKDHARRFRLRALMAEGIRQEPHSVDDLAGYLDDLLEEDETLSRALVPEVWQVERRIGPGGRHARERRKYLRFQVLREVALTSRQARGLEPWGRMKVEYVGLAATSAWIQEHAHQLGIAPERLCDGVAGVLDYLRRRGALYDPEHGMFTKYWMEGDREIQQGYLSGFLAPNATKLRRTAGENANLVTQWLSDTGGDTTMRQIARKWAVPTDAIEPFLEGLFGYLVARELLLPVRLKGSQGRPLPKVSGVYQVNADRLRLCPNRGVRRCKSCRRTTMRDLPHNRCLAFRCDGEIEWVPEDEDNYDLQMLDGAYAMLRPEEHTAMVPNQERERLENLFKGASDAVNCLVCTPTLELGIDIGALDAVLMRNVPPLPANYWQRAGRAGRRHRMAVDITYCRPASHDRAYFAEPTKLLAGRIDPPAFNLRNEVMVAKHVHATVVAGLHRYAQEEREAERPEARAVLARCLPRRVEPYLFDEGEVRHAPFGFDELRALVAHRADGLAAAARQVFEQGWPEADASVVRPEALRRHVDAFVDELEAVVERLRRRLRWAMDQIKRLNQVRERQGTLAPEDESLFRRCDNLVKRLKGAGRQRSAAEGHDDANTFSVLAAEGFLPGYGLEAGAVVGWAEIPFWRSGAMDFSLPRPPALALREYVPGNLIYANGHRFVARRFHQELRDERAERPFYEVSAERQAVRASAHGEGSLLGGKVLRAIAVCDADLVHASHISDEEELRFQLGVAIYGLELGEHSGGRAFRWGAQALQLRHGVRLRLINVGPSAAVRAGEDLGYPICTVCGLSVSPLASERQRRQFADAHAERCGKPPDNVGFFANVVADALSLPGCEDARAAYSLLEALRIGACQVLDMHMDDLQILVIGHVEREQVDAVLWDPMPGGSGLLERLCERFEDVAHAAAGVVAGCPAVCASSCIDCLQTFRNAYYHRYLDRHVAAQRLAEWGGRLAFEHDIPPRQADAAASDSALPANEAEARLRSMLLAAGFGEGTRGERIRLGGTLGTTTPDVVYRAEDHDPDEGACIYLDGLSRHIHGNPETAEQDRDIRAWLRGSGFEVVEIAASDLDDEAAMVQHFRRLAGYLGRADLRQQVRGDTSWFLGEQRGSKRPALRLVIPTAASRYVTCVPLVPLAAAAGAFGAPHAVPDESEWQWVAPATSRPLREGMFVAQVVGESMAPTIPNGSHCLFASPVTGTRQGRVVLVQLEDDADPETGQRFTVKRYRSAKTADENGWRHVAITLGPDNPAFAPIELTAEDEGRVEVVAEFLEVVGGGELAELVV